MRPTENGPESNPRRGQNSVPNDVTHRERHRDTRDKKLDTEHTDTQTSDSAQTETRDTLGITLSFCMVLAISIVSRLETRRLTHNAVVKDGIKRHGLPVNYKCLECFYHHTNVYYDVLGEKFDAGFGSDGRIVFFVRRQKRMFEGKKSQGRIVNLRSGKKDSVPFSKHFKTDQVFKISYAHFNKFQIFNNFYSI